MINSCSDSCGVSGGGAHCGGAETRSNPSKHAAEPPLAQRLHVMHVPLQSLYHRILGLETSDGILWHGSSIAISRVSVTISSMTTLLRDEHS
jgi:hypothetical protein